MQELIPHGAKKKVVEVVMRQVVKALRGDNGNFVLGALLNGYLDVLDKFQPEEGS